MMKTKTLTENNDLTYLLTDNICTCKRKRVNNRKEVEGKLSKTKLFVAKFVLLPFKGHGYFS